MIVVVVRRRGRGLSNFNAVVVSRLVSTRALSLLSLCCFSLSHSLSLSLLFSLSPLFFSLSFSLSLSKVYFLMNQPNSRVELVFIFLLIWVAATPASPRLLHPVVPIF